MLKLYLIDFDQCKNLVTITLVVVLWPNLNQKSMNLFYLPQDDSDPNFFIILDYLMAKQLKLTPIVVQAFLTNRQLLTFEQFS